MRCLDGAAEVDTRIQNIARQADLYAAALSGSTDPAAQVWAEALAWFAKRIQNGQPGHSSHKEFTARFGVDPYSRPGFKQNPKAP